MNLLKGMLFWFTFIEPMKLLVVTPIPVVRGINAEKAKE
jgi:hypothetical protein